ncbi:MAG: family 16 glycosylhydrolase, partial [Candidatus Cryptobacteroides sp.]
SFNAQLGRSTVYENKYRSAIFNDLTADLVWSDNPDLEVSGKKITLSSGRYLQLAFNNAVNGSNAVVAMKGTDGEVLWSWHIWFTDYNPDNILDRTSGKVENGLVHKYKGTMWEGSGIYSDKYMMDRNLGARLVGYSSAKYPSASNLYDYFGLYYQFGRKDPFPTEGISAGLSAVTAPVTIEEGVLNPGTFYTSSSASDWIDNGGNCLDLWAGKSDIVLEKSPFDPCPSGWRVPICYLSDDYGSVRLNTWSDFSADYFKARDGYFLYKGTDFNSDGTNNTVYPMAGRLSQSSGSPYMQQSEGCYWSASPQASYASGAAANGRYFLFKSAIDGGSTSGSAAVRSNGLSVRCVQDGSYAAVTPHWELNKEKSDDFYVFDEDKWQTSAWFTDTYCAYSGSNVSVSDGMLRIALKKETSGGKNYTAGVAKSKFTVGAGTAVEFRAKMAPHAAHIRNALWLSDTPVAAKNPNMEIDLLETWASDTWPDWKFSSGILYWWIGNDKPSWYKESANGMMPIGLLYYRQDHSSSRTEKWLSEDFHIFRLERTSESVRFLIDGKLYWERFCDSETYASDQTAPSTDDADSNNMMTAENFAQVLLQERNLIMSVHSSGAVPTDSYLPCELQIDYVHVYDYVE